MQLTINIPDSMLDEALALGLPPQEFVEKVLRSHQLESASITTEFPQTAENTHAKKIREGTVTPEERAAWAKEFIQKMSRFAAKTPDLPDEAYTRESFYQR